jgi:hypothetical protein
MVLGEECCIGVRVVVRSMVAVAVEEGIVGVPVKERRSRAVMEGEPRTLVGCIAVLRGSRSLVFLRTAVVGVDSHQISVHNLSRRYISQSNTNNEHHFQNLTEVTYPSVPAVELGPAAYH